MDRSKNIRHRVHPWPIFSVFKNTHLQTITTDATKNLGREQIYR